MLMFHPIKQKYKSNIYLQKTKELFSKNIRVCKSYWPIITIMQLIAFIGCLIWTNQRPIQQTEVIIDKKSLNFKQREDKINELEKQFQELKKRFLALQVQHAKFVKSSILMATNTPNSVLQAQDTKKIASDIIDRIGEKIRLNNPYSNLLTLLPKECTSFSGYQTLHEFASNPPSNPQRLQKSFEDIRKKYTSHKKRYLLPKWLEKIASLFHGEIKIEKIHSIDETSFNLITEALELQDLKLAFSIAKNISIQPFQKWTNELTKRIKLEEEFMTFSTAIQQWIQQESSEKSIPDQENLP